MAQSMIKCKHHNCERLIPNPESGEGKARECGSCRGLYYRLRKAESGGNRSKIAVLEQDLNSSKSALQDLQKAFESLQREHEAQGFAYKNLLEKYLQRETLFRSGSVIGTKSVENISRMLESGVETKCVGCREDLPSQRAHCDPITGCLAISEDFVNSFSSFALDPPEIADSLKSKKKKYLPENCMKCGGKIYKRGPKAVGTKYCDC